MDSPFTQSQMHKSGNVLVLMLLIFTLASCSITNKIRSLQIEVLKPAGFIIPEDVRKVAIINRYLLNIESHPANSEKGNLSYGVDTVSKNSLLSNHCLNALRAHLEEGGKFLSVRNFTDSIVSLKNPKISEKELLTAIQSDIFILLDTFSFKIYESSKYENLLEITCRPDWSIVIKNLNSSYYYFQRDGLVADCPKGLYKLKNAEYQKILLDAAANLGRSFGAKLIPGWESVKRMYYYSGNSNMRKAEQFVKKNNFLKAAEFWRLGTKSKNQALVAKATYNMALAAEMSGKYDAAIDWLTKSYNVLPEKNKSHKANCKRYIDVLASRKKDLKLLDKQIRE